MFFGNNIERILGATRVSQYTGQHSPMGGSMIDMEMIDDQWSAFCVDHQSGGGWVGVGWGGLMINMEGIISQYVECKSSQC